MELSKAEAKALQVLRRRVRGWWWLRWLHVLASLALFGGGIWGVLIQRDLWLRLGEEPLEPVASVFVYMMARGEVMYHFCGLMGALLLAYTILNWRGRVVDTLLIRLARELGFDDEGRPGPA